MYSIEGPNKHFNNNESRIASKTNNTNRFICTTIL